MLTPALASAAAATWPIDVGKRPHQSLPERALNGADMLLRPTVLAEGYGLRGEQVVPPGVPVEVRGTVSHHHRKRRLGQRKGGHGRCTMLAVRSDLMQLRVRCRIS